MLNEVAYYVFVCWIMQLFPEGWTWMIVCWDFTCSRWILWQFVERCCDFFDLHCPCPVHCPFGVGQFFIAINLSEIFGIMQINDLYYMRISFGRLLVLLVFSGGIIFPLSNLRKAIQILDSSRMLPFLFRKFDPTIANLPPPSKWRKHHSKAPAQRVCQNISKSAPKLRGQMRVHHNVVFCGWGIIIIYDWCPCFPDLMVNIIHKRKY